MYYASNYCYTFIYVIRHKIFCCSSRFLVPRTHLSDSTLPKTKLARSNRKLLKKKEIFKVSNNNNNDNKVDKKDLENEWFLNKVEAFTKYEKLNPYKPASIPLYLDCAHACAKLNRYEKAVKVLEQLELVYEKQIFPPPKTVNVINKPSESPENNLYNITPEFIRRKVTKINNILLANFIKTKNYEAAEQFFITLKLKKSYLLSEASYTTLIKGFVEIKNFKKAVKYLRILETEENFRKSVLPYNVLIKGYFSTKKISSALALVSSLKQTGIQLNSYFYAIVLDGLINCGQLEEALSLFEDLKKKDLSQMNIKEERQERCLSSVAYAVVISGLLSKTRVDAALIYYKEMKKKRLHFSLVSYNSLIDGLLKNDKEEEAESILRELTKFKLRPNAATFTSFVCYYSKKLAMQKAETYASLIEKSGYQLDAIPFVCLIDGYFRSKNFTEMEACFVALKKKNIQLPPFTFNVVLWNAVENAENYEDCWKLYSKLQEAYGERCDIAKTRTHVKFYYRILKEGGLEKTHALLKVLERHKVPVDVGMVNAYIEECMQLFEIALMEKFWRDHVETPDGGIREGSVDATTLALLVEGFAGRGHIENAIHYFEKIKGVARLQGNIMHVYNTLVDACLKLGYTHVAEQYKCEMARLINQ